MRKPDERFYKLALERVGCEASECVFLDDIGLNLKAAEKLGINTIREDFLLLFRFCWTLRSH